MILSSLTPIFAVIMVGLLLSRTPLASPPNWELMERLTYYLFFPSLLVLRLAGADFDQTSLQSTFWVMGTALTVLSVLFVGLRQFFSSSPAELSSIYQGSIRFNTYVGLAVVEALYADRGLQLAAVGLSVYIPAVNLLSVIALTANSGDMGKRLVMVVGTVFTNPLVLACMLGLGLSYTDTVLPGLLEQTLTVLSQPALPLGLLAVGAGIRFLSLGQQNWPLLVAIGNKLLIFPGLVLVSCVVLIPQTRLAAVLVLLAALPAPPSAYILARQLGGDASLMANIISVQTLLAFFTLPLWMQAIQRFL